MCPSLVMAACVLVLATGVAAQRNVKVGIVADPALGSYPFAYPDPAAKDGVAGYEVALMESLCQHANWTCKKVELTNLEDRILALLNNTIDWTISQLSFTPARAIAIQFVKPYYYSSGVSLFATPPPDKQPSILTAPTLQSSTIGWESFTVAGLFGSSRRVCFLEGYYATAFIVQDYNIEVETVQSIEEGANKVRDGTCAAFAYDSVTPASQVGLPVLDGVPPAYISPFGIAVRKGDQELYDALALGLLDTMNQGLNYSAIMQYERDDLVKNGVQPNKGLANLVAAVSDFAEAPSAGPRRIPPDYRFLG